MTLRRPTLKLPYVPLALNRRVRGSGSIHYKSPPSSSSSLSAFFLIIIIKDQSLTCALRRRADIVSLKSLTFCFVLFQTIRAVISDESQVLPCCSCFQKVETTRWLFASIAMQKVDPVRFAPWRWSLETFSLIRAFSVADTPSRLLH